MKVKSLGDKNSWAARVLVILVIAVVYVIVYGLNRSNQKQQNLNVSTTEQEQGSTSPIIDGTQSIQRPLEDPYSGWRDNASLSHRFNYKYPSGSEWSLSQGDNAGPDNGRLYTSSVALDEDSDSEGVVNVFEIVVAKKGSAQDFNAERIKNSMSKNELYALVKDETVQRGGLTGTVLEYQSKDENLGNIKYYFFERGGLVYNVVINYLGEKSSSTNIVEIGDKILNSISFTQ